MPRRACPSGAQGTTFAGLEGRTLIRPVTPQIVMQSPSVVPTVILPPAQAAAPTAPQPLELLVTYLPMALIVAAAWLLLYKPERERMRRHQDLLAALKKNDRVVTTSGIYGTVANVDREGDRVLLRVDEAGNVRIAVTLSSISRVLGDKGDREGSDVETPLSS